MDQTFIKELITLVSNSNIDEFTLESDHIKVSCKKNGVKMVEPMMEVVAKPSATTENKELLHHVPKAVNTIDAPLVGTFYSKPAPDAKAFVSVGEKVEVGQKIAIIEAMKVMNEIKATKSGVITKICVEDGMMVESHQPLFEIEAYD